MKPILKMTMAAGLLAMTQGANAQRLTPPANIPDLPTPSGRIIQVQSNDAFRVNELEEQVRRLNGKVEELNFLLLELQEKLRKMEEDNEGRFQELEAKRSSLETPQNADKVAQAPDAADQPEDQRLGKPEPSVESTSTDVKSDEKPSPSPRVVHNLEPRALGTLTFDKDGNVVDARPAEGRQLDKLPGVFDNGVDGSVEAAQFGSTPAEVFRVAKAALDARHYKRAEQAFAAHLKAWPEDPDTGEAKYYLAEAMFWQKNYFAAADLHLDAHNNYPEAKTAADNLLGLGLALAGLNQREVACATYAEVLKQYPETAPRLGERIKDEQAAARC